MAYTVEQLHALEKALASGVLRVTYNGQSVEYRSIADLRAAIAEVRTGLAGKRIRQVQIFGSKGL